MYRSNSACCGLGRTLWLVACGAVLAAVGCEPGSEDATPTPDQPAPATSAQSARGGSPDAEGRTDESTSARSVGAVAAPGPSAVPAEALDGAALRVQRLVVTTGIDEREPVSVDGFSADGEPVVAFVELANRSEAPRKIVIVFEHEAGDKVGFVELTVPADARRWRTWGRSNRVRRTGRWAAVVLADGRELARTPFEVQG